MEKVSEDFQTFYQMEEAQPPSLPLATHVNSDRVNDDIPSEAEVEERVRHLRPHTTGGHTHLHADHFKQWCRESYPG